VPRTTNHTEQRRRIAHATWEVIGTRGLDGTSVREVARAAGCTTGTLSHYFRNRDEMVAFAFDLVVTDLCAEVEQRAAALPEGRARLEVLVEEFLPSPDRSDPRAVVTVAAWALAAHDPEIAAQHRSHYDRLRALASHYISEAIAIGDVASDTSPHDTADLLISFADGLFVASLLEPERFPRDRQVQLTQAFIDRFAPSHSSAAA
jgi:AcrR family transcriptional regulator